MNADGSGRIRLTNNPSADTEPAWSPDESRIAFRSDRDGNAEIYTISTDGSGLTNIINSPADESNPAWQSAPKL